MTERARLPDRRGHQVISFRHGGIDYVAGIGRYDDGRPGELFLSAAKLGTDADVAARDAAVAGSLALQFGCPVETLRRALTRDANDDPSGPVGRVLDLLTGDTE